MRGRGGDGGPVLEYDDGFGTLGDAFIARAGIRSSLMESIAVV